METHITLFYAVHKHFPQLEFLYPKFVANYNYPRPPFYNNGVFLLFLLNSDSVFTKLLFLLIYCLF